MQVDKLRYLQQLSDNYYHTHHNNHNHTHTHHNHEDEDSRLFHSVLVFVTNAVYG